jgi:hypothetical protein
MIFGVFWDGLWTLSFGLSRFHGQGSWLMCEVQSPTLGAHAHAHAHPYLWVLGGHGCEVIVHGWAWMGIGFVHLCIQLQIEVKLVGCKEYNERSFICPIQPRLGVGG